MTDGRNNKPYNLEERTQKFAKEVYVFINLVPKTMVNTEVLKQLVRSAGSVGANFIEANEAFSRKDFALRIKICRKEAKESIYWLSLIQLKTAELEKERTQLSDEATELMRIFGAIIEKSKG
jgi:four helix bundle protein